MADINKTDIRLLSSQRLDDTTQGGGQMTSIAIISGSVNNLYPDISRFDRVYGRVSLRKAFLAVQTTNRPTYYGSHAALTMNAKDPNVSVCFFSSESWFDTRESARQRIEAYLVKGPFFPAALWGNHYRGSRQLQLHSHKDWPPPSIGDVLVLVEYEGLSNEKYQYVRITKVTTRTDAFTVNLNTTYQKKILTLDIGEMLVEDYTGEEIFWEGSGVNYGSSGQNTRIYTTVAADASQYYGVAKLSEDADAGSLHVRVDSINVPLVPSAQSPTSITDAGVGQALTPMLQTNEDFVSVTRSIAYTIAANSKLHIGEGVLPGSFNWVGGLTLTDNAKGDILSNGVVVGTITYATGICIFTNVTGSTSGTGVITYIPACSPTEVASTGAIEVTIGNRGFVYVFNCNPLPKRGTVKIDYLSNGKWYTIQDQGNGSISGYDPAIGAGSVNYITGSISMTLGAMPDVGSFVLIFWAKDAPYYDLSGETLPLRYEFTTTNTGIARNSFVCSWNSEAGAVVDDGAGNLTVGVWSTDHWVKSATEVGTIHYANGRVEFTVHSSQPVPLTSEDMHVVYHYGDKFNTTFNPSREGDGSVYIIVPTLPIVPGTLSVERHTDQEQYDVLTQYRGLIDPTWRFQDDTLGYLKNETGGGNPGFFSTTINYATGVIHLMPDRRGTFPRPNYGWVDSGQTSGLAPGVSKWNYVFTGFSYFPAASIFPTDGIITVEWCCTSGSSMDDYYIELPKKFFIKENSHIEIVPGSVDLTATVDATTYYMMDVGTGKLFRDVVGTTGIGTECGTINYATRVVTITDNTILNRTVLVKSCAGTAAVDPAQMMTFRAPAAPLVVGVGGIRATLGTGTVLSGYFQSDGSISGQGMIGTVDYITGVCKVAFGAWVEDEWDGLPEYDPDVAIEDPPICQAVWYAGSTTDGGGNVWKPYSVRASTVMLNCVVTSYLPLDAELLGLDPVRLPLDGKVPIFRDGYVILVHHTLKDNLPDPIVAGATYTLSRGNVELIELYDKTGKYFPEIDGAINYSVDLTLGTVTVAPTVVVTGYEQPFYAIHRREDMCLASDVQITGHIAVTNSLKHSYPKDDTLVSSVLPSADLQARCYNEFVQSSWDGAWSDDPQDTGPLANYDFVNFPVTVHNKGATKERWLIKFTSSNLFDVIGEHLGVLMKDVNLPTQMPVQEGTSSGWLDGYLIVKNRLTTEDYFKIAFNGFGVGWASGNNIRLNTDAANFPYWFVRTTLQAPPTEPIDSYEFQIRGDSA